MCAVGRNLLDRRTGDDTAMRAGVPVEDLMDRIRQQFVTQAVVGQEISSRLTVTREEIQQYYDEHKDDFIQTEGVRLAEILISNENATTAEALAEVEKEAGAAGVAHFGRRRPCRPLLAVLDVGAAGPQKTFLADADTVAQRVAAGFGLLAVVSEVDPAA